MKDDFLIDYSKSDNVHNKLKEIKEEQLRGKKHAKHHVALLTFMLDKANEPRQKVEIYLNLLNAIFSSAKTATPQGFLTRDGWVGALNYVKELLKILNEPLNKASLSKIPSGEESEYSSIDIEKNIIPSFISFLQKLDQELLKAFQNTNHAKFEYLQRIRDENKFLFLCDSVHAFIN